MKIKLKAKFSDNTGLNVSIAGAPVQLYQPDTVRGILHQLIDEISCPFCLARIMDTVIVSHSEVIMEDKPKGYKATLKTNA